MIGQPDTPPTLIVRTYQDTGLWIGYGGRLEGPRAPQIETVLREAGAGLAPVAGEPPGRLRERPAGERAIADLACYFAVTADPERLGDDLVDRLRETAEVEFAYLRPPVALPRRDVGPPPEPAEEPPGPPEDLRSHQGYLDAAPGGIGAEAAWERPGGRGEGVAIVDVEGDWRFSHEDLHHNRGGIVGGRPTGDLEARNHGTNVVGMLGGVHNGRGVNGICPEASIKGVSYQPELPQWGSGPAIKFAADLLRPGDILLLEMMLAGPRTPRRGQPGFSETSEFGYLPVDYWPDALTSIEYAVTKGVVVVLAAGNGSQHLDDPLYAGPGPGFREHRPNPFARGDLDSGAIVVGAGAPPPGTHGKDHGPDRSRLDFSNWGSELDAQGWGREVTTTGGLGHGPDTLRPGEFEDRWYTDRFSGTSSAAPMVAGALACVQGVLRAAGRAPLTPAQARAALRETGSPQQPAADGTLQRIGNRPDIGALIEWAMAAPTDTRRRRMKVTITIEDGDGRSASWQAAPGIEPPYIKGPSLVLTHEDGTKTELNVEALKAAAAERKAGG